MIFKDQQIKIAYNFLSKFSGKSYAYDYDRFSLFLNENKYASKLLGDYKIIVLWTILKYSPKNTIDLLDTLNNLTEDDIHQAMAFKRQLLAKDYELKQDIQTIKNSDLPVHLLYKKHKISFWGFYYYCKKYPDKCKGRIVNRDLERIKTLLDILKID